MLVQVQVHIGQAHQMARRWAQLSVEYRGPFGETVALRTKVSAMDTHPGCGGLPTHPVSPQIIHYAREDSVSTLGHGYVLQRVQEVRFITRRGSCNKN